MQCTKTNKQINEKSQKSQICKKYDMYKKGSDKSSCRILVLLNGYNRNEEESQQKVSLKHIKHTIRGGSATQDNNKQEL